VAKLVLAEGALARGDPAPWGAGRRHLPEPHDYGGRIQHTVCFSMIDSEWPAVKARLEAKLISRNR